MPWFAGAAMSGVDVGGSEGQPTEVGVLVAAVVKNSPDHHLLPASVVGTVTTDHGLTPDSPRDWLRLALFVMLGLSLIFAIRYTVRDLSH
jgi:hypothetical protein